MVNYLARRVNSTPYVQLIQWEMWRHGEDRVLAAYAAHPPDYIVVISRYLFEYEFPHQGERFLAWILEHYRPLEYLEGPPFWFEDAVTLQFLQYRPDLPRRPG